MSNINAFRLALSVCLAGTLAGCKVAVIVVEGGWVFGYGPALDCYAGSICLTETTTADLDHEYYVRPDPGWYFVRWNSGGNFLCGGSFSEVCEVNNTALAGIPAAEALIASSQTFYIQPIFAQYQDTVLAAGRTWYQPLLFTNLSWDAINAVCPGGPCLAGGMLNGQDMTGWTWASVDDVNALFNSYLSTSELGPGPDRFEVSLDEVAELVPFYRSGWKITYEDVGYYWSGFSGWTATAQSAENAYHGVVQLGRYDWTNYMDTSGAMPKSYLGTGTGSWFYREYSH